MVYLAEHTRLDTVVAVKEILIPHSGKDEEDRKNLIACENEARMLVKLNHPNLPRVMDAFMEGDRFYLVMEYIEGVTLEAYLLNNEIKYSDIDHLLDWALQILDVLTYLHNQSPPIIFRDLKPANIMLQKDGLIRLIDFGIARRFQPETTKDTSLLGSVGYSPPEQFGRNQTDTRSDIYSFGATLHHILTGRDPSRQPFKFAAVRNINPDAPDALAKLIARCVALEPENRPQTTEELKQELLSIRSSRQNHEDAIPPSTESTHDLQLEANQETHASTHDRRRSIVHITIASIIIVLIAGSVMLFSEMKRRSFISNSHSKSAFASPNIHSSIPDISSNTSPNSVDSSNQNTDPGVSSNAPIVSSYVTAIVQTPVMQQEVYMLPISVKGEIVGHQGAQMVISAYFSAEDHSPIMAVDHRSIYANPDGRLSSAVTLSIDSDPKSFSTLISIPISEFPPDQFTGSIRAHIVVQDADHIVCSARTDISTIQINNYLVSQGASPIIVPLNQGTHNANPPVDTNRGAGIFGGNSSN